MRPMKHALLPLTVCALLLGGVAQADDATEEGHTRLRLHFSQASATELVAVVVGNHQRSAETTFLARATWGQDLSDTLLGLPVPMAGHVGVQYLAERGHQRDGWGATTVIKANYRMPVPSTQK